ncbi:(deoxy)nucleoside triphosphate pyrophosphohydrolase [Candidatus Poribacteria bacterium]|nr:(deoxy)nucleoside triphosphate pyrophosphohydrolase [Candidatus Poribacteria bacterium]
MSSDPRHKVVVAAVIELGGKLLLHQRPPGKWGAGKWELPGGKVENDEDPRRALERECLEELGVIVSAGAIYEVLSHHYDGLGSVILLFIRAVIVTGEPQALDGGAIAWAGALELSGYDWLEADLPLAARLGREMARDTDARAMT